jgi:hypothetical protein
MDAQPRPLCRAATCFGNVCSQFALLRDPTGVLLLLLLLLLCVHHMQWLQLGHSPKN